MAVIAPNGPYEIQKAPPKLLLRRLPMSPGPRDSPSLAGHGPVPEPLGLRDGPARRPPARPAQVASTFLRRGSRRLHGMGPVARIVLYSRGLINCTPPPNRPCPPTLGPPAGPSNSLKTRSRILPDPPHTTLPGGGQRPPPRREVIRRVLQYSRASFEEFEGAGGGPRVGGVRLINGGLP